MALRGEQLLTEALQLAAMARSQIAAISGLSVFEFESPILGFHSFDRTRLTVDVTKLGLTGFAADEILRQKLGVTAELPMLRNLTFIISFGNRKADIKQLVHAFTTLAAEADFQQQQISDLPRCLPSGFTLYCSPREAF